MRLEELIEMRLAFVDHRYTDLFCHTERYAQANLQDRHPTKVVNGACGGVAWALCSEEVSMLEA